MTARKTRSPTAAASVDQPEAAPAPPSPPPAPPAQPPAQPPALIIAEDPCAPPEPYDPADYRWVPVRRRARYDGWTEEKQRRFIEELADTGQVSLAAKAVGMNRENAYKLRRQPHAAAFARAWDAARAGAGSLLEDIAFERAIEGTAHNVFDENGAVIATRQVVNDRLLMFLLRNLKPERYSRHALERLALAKVAPGETINSEPCAELGASLAALEPALPAPATTLLDAATLDAELELAEIADGQLPAFLAERQRDPPAALAAAAAERAQAKRGQAFELRWLAGETLSAAERTELDQYLDPSFTPEPSRKRYR